MKSLGKSFFVIKEIKSTWCVMQFTSCYVHMYCCFLLFNNTATSVNILSHDDTYKFIFKYEVVFVLFLIRKRKWLKSTHFPSCKYTISCFRWAQITRTPRIYHTDLCIKKSSIIYKISIDNTISGRSLGFLRMGEGQNSWIYHSKIRKILGCGGGCLFLIQFVIANWWYDRRLQWRARWGGCGRGQ